VESLTRRVAGARPNDCSESNSGIGRGTPK